MPFKDTQEGKTHSFNDGCETHTEIGYEFRDSVGNLRVMRKCDVCGSIYSPRKTDIKRRKNLCCSIQCGNKKISASKIESLNPQWRGDKVGYGCLHRWVERKLGKPNKCDKCSSADAKRYEWANISGEYKRDLTDWIRLCKSCHNLFDGNVTCKNGHSLGKDNLYIIKTRPNCRICKKCVLSR